jgi:hypothetical protein
MTMRSIRRSGAVGGRVREKKKVVRMGGLETIGPPAGKSAAAHPGGHTDAPRGADNDGDQRFEPGNEAGHAHAARKEQNEYGVKRKIHGGFGDG